MVLAGGSVGTKTALAGDTPRDASDSGIPARIIAIPPEKASAFFALKRLNRLVHASPPSSVIRYPIVKRAIQVRGLARRV